MTEIPATPQSIHQQRLALAVMAGVAALTVLRLTVASFIELMPEEAYYWTYFQHPALSYYDHPPMVAWCIGLGTAILGNTEFGVRLITILLSLATSALMFATVRIWYGRTTAWWAVGLFNLLPIYLTIGLFSFPDGPLVCFWMLALYGVSDALHERHLLGWLWAGLGFGGALLSKYTAVLFAPSLLLFLWISPPHRHWLRRPHPWLALGLGLTMFIPVVIWNSQNQWASFLFQSTRTMGGHNRPIRNAAIFWLQQIVLLTPLVLLLFGQTLRRAWRQSDASGRFLLGFAVPFLLVFIAASFKTQVRLNWTAPAFVALIPGAAALARERFSSSRPWRMAAGITGVLVAMFLGLGLCGVIWGRPKIFAASNVGGWRLLAAEVDRAEDEIETNTGQTAFILGADKYNLAAELGFYSREPEEVVNLYALGAQGLGFRYWTKLREFEGHPAIAVMTTKNWETTFPELRRHFERVDEPHRIEVPSLGKRQRVVYLIRCYGYKLPAGFHP